jgi:hypothetical protein
MSVVNVEELRSLFEDDLAANLYVVRKDVEALEEWLGSPPAGANEEDIGQKKTELEQAREWLAAYEAEMARRMEITTQKAALHDEMAQLEKERATATSHSDLAMLDDWEDDILRRLDALDTVDKSEGCGCCYRR